MRLSVTFLTVLLAGASASRAQSPHPFVPPTLKGDRNVAAQAALAAPANDPASLYQNRHEAAIAALKEANRIAATGHGNDRVVNLLLIAVKRDPNFGKPIYNLGVMCAKGERWEDAINFYKEAMHVDPSPELVKLTTTELARVQLISSLQATPEGRRRLQFDAEFLGILKMSNDPAVALDALDKLARKESSRWELYALRGILSASLHRYAESASALESAGKIAPTERRRALAEAADLERREARYEELVRTGDLAWEKQEYEPAAKQYASAWETSPGRPGVGMQAAVGFLMADQVSYAVQMLSRLQQTAPPEYSQKAAAMLKELGSFSEDAQKASTATRSGAAEGSTQDIAEHIRKSLGDLASQEMKLENQPPPSLLEDNTPFAPIADSDFTGPEVAYLSTESIFTRYKGAIAAAAPAAPETGAPPAAPADPSQTAAPPAGVSSPVEIPGRPAKLDLRPGTPALAPERKPDVQPPDPGKPSKPPVAGSERSGQISSQPAGAGVVFDNDPSLKCVTPCQIPLSPGRHTLTATLKGYRDVLKILTVDKTGTPPGLDLTFERKQGVIYVTSSQPGAAIYLDGKKTEQVTPAKLTVDEGDHEIGLEVDGAIIKKPVSIKDGDQLQLSQ